MIEAISFVLFMLDDKLRDIILSLLDNQKENAKGLLALVYSRVIGGRLAKELVTATANRNMQIG